MITNSEITIYHKGLNEETKLETWTRFNYKSAWVFGGKGANINEGYNDANNLEVRLPYSKNNGLNIENFSIGDIIVQGNITEDIETQQDLEDYLIYNITSIKNNNFGLNQHIHLGGK